MKDIYIAFLVSLVLSSCVTSSVVINVKRPADITISQDIQDVVAESRPRRYGCKN